MKFLHLAHVFLPFAVSHVLRQLSGSHEDDSGKDELGMPSGMPSRFPKSIQTAAALAKQ